MKKINLLLGVIALFLVIAFVANASAITGRLANSRMVLRLDVGESVEKYLGVENVNDIPITVKLVPLGDLNDSIELREAEFVLQPGESKKAYFTITADKSGTTETKINVFFTPAEGNGIALPATIIVVTSGEGSDTTDETPDETNETDDSGFTFNPGSNSNPNQDDQTEGMFSKISPMMLLLALSILLIIVFVILIILASKRNGKKRAGRPRA